CADLVATRVAERGHPGGAVAAGGGDCCAQAAGALPTAAELGAIYAPLVSGSVLLLLLWLILYWMYRRQVFVRV
ncbi:MAG: hypothetical protein ACK5TO_20400, partial [Planctomycetaceae bacterium]